MMAISAEQPFRTFPMRALLRFVSLIALIAALSRANEPSRVHIQMDTSEADAVLHILDKKAAGQTVTDGDWRRIFDSRPYRRLKEREAAMKRPFTDDEFRDFVLTGEAAGRGGELRRALEEWRRADLKEVAAKLLAYLPANAAIGATVYPVIKPKHNSFVWELDEDPAIFLFLDPAVTAAQFENTAAHELHHVGLHSVNKYYQALIAPLSEHARSAAEWMGGFGEGFAMLAAAGSPGVHPHAGSNLQDRERWDRDMANFDSDLTKLDDFFRDIVSGKLSREQASERGMAFFGIQGPWYTIGYKMAAAVEKRYGRRALLQCMEDPRKLPAAWNQIAGANAKWSGDVLAAVKAEAITRR